MKRTWFQMSYDEAEGRWIVEAEDEVLALHCGNFLEIRIGDQGIPCRIELDRDWYVIMQGGGGDLISARRIRIKSEYSINGKAQNRLSRRHTIHGQYSRHILDN